MKGILNEIFRANVFKLHELKSFKDWSISFAVPEKSKEAIFYLVAVKNDASFEDLKALDEKGFKEIFLELKSKSERWRDFEKNTTFIICYDGPSENEKEIWKIAKDPFGFKKNILLFNPDEVSSFFVLVDGNLGQESLNSHLNSSGYFEGLKAGNVNKGYSLLLKLFSCLPFLVYNPPKKEIGNLETEISEKLEQENLSALANHIIEKIDLPNSIDDDFADKLLRELENEI